MTVSRLIDDLGFRPLWTGWTDRTVTGAHTSDLLSDVMAHADEGDVLLTIQAHKNTVAVATLKDLAAVVICSDRPVTDDMLEAARAEDLPLLITEDDQYTAGWKIHGIAGF